MQPTYLPWLGYFTLLDQVDLFVFLDDVAFSRQSWQQRNRIKGVDGEVLLTIPVRKRPLGTAISEIEIDWEHTFPRKHLMALEDSYAEAPYFGHYWSQLSDRIQDAPASLAESNQNLILWIAEQAGIHVDWLLSSQVEASGRKDEYLANICEYLGASVYLSPLGAKEYLETSAEFKRRHIAVQYMTYNHPRYPQLHGDFISHLSTVDALFNVGGQGVADLIRAGGSGVV